MDRIVFAAVSLHNFALTRNRKIAQLGAYRIVKVLPNILADKESYDAAITEMRSNDRLTDWTDTLRRGYEQLSEGRPKYILYYFPPPEIAKHWFSPRSRERDLDRALLQLDSFLIALRLRKPERVFMPPETVLAMAVPAPEIFSIYKGEAPATSEFVPHMNRPPYLGKESVYRLGARDLAAVERACELASAGFETSLAVPMRRFIESQEKPAADRFIDLLVALEALYGDEDSTSAAHKIAFRAATVVGTSPSRREKLFPLIKKIYGQRSRILHGRSAGTSLDNMRELEDVVRDSLVWFLERLSLTGVAPIAPDIDKMCFDSVVVRP